MTGRLDERHSTWERPAEAAARFQAGIDALAGGTAIVASHGMVITAWLTTRGFVAAGDAAGDLWTHLGYPELIEVNGRLRQGFARGRVVLCTGELDEHRASDILTRES